MLFRAEFLEGIQQGTITLAFRRWRRPTVRAHGTLLTSIGQLHIGEITRVLERSITLEETRRAGYRSRAQLLEELNQRADGEIYRIELGPLRADPRVALRSKPDLAEEERAKLQSRLDRMDASSPDGAWTLRTLQLLATHEAQRAGDLCGLLGQDKEQFKRNVRKLKNLGLTESLSVGYRLSPRGRSLLGRMAD